jgi:hypothetical protein
MGQPCEFQVIVAGRPMHAVLNYSCMGSPALPSPMEDAYLGDLRVDANALANFSVFAPGARIILFNL